MELLRDSGADLLRLRGAQAAEARAQAAASRLSRAPETEGDRAELKKAAQEMESFFLYMMLKSMRKTIQKSDVFGDRKKEDTYTEMMDMEITKELARAGGIGLAPVILAGLDPALRGAGGRPRGEGAPEKKEGYPLPPRPAEKPDVPPAGKPLPEGPGEAREFFWRRPVEGRVSSRFGYRDDPMEGTRRFHSGVDIAAPEGASVLAVRPGRVVFAGKEGGYGNLVEILHPDNTVTRYAHNSALWVKTGDAVVSGQVIAEAGSTGRSTGPHLHFEVLREGRRVDPMEVLLRSRI